MTQQYIVGQLSSLLGDLQRAPHAQLVVRELRTEVERAPLRGLPRLAREAITLADNMCWAALENGDLSGFRECAKTAAQLGEFTDNARLLVE